MSNKKSAKRDHAKAVNDWPTCAEDCNMEEAFGLGLMNGPNQDCKSPKQNDVCRNERPRTDITQSPKV